MSTGSADGIDETAVPFGYRMISMPPGRKRDLQSAGSQPTGVTSMTKPGSVSMLLVEPKIMLLIVIPWKVDVALMLFEFRNASADSCRGAKPATTSKVLLGL